METVAAPKLSTFVYISCALKLRLLRFCASSSVSLFYKSVLRRSIGSPETAGNVLIGDGDPFASRVFVRLVGGSPDFYLISRSTDNMHPPPSVSEVPAGCWPEFCFWTEIKLAAIGRLERFAQAVGEVRKKPTGRPPVH
jgi:hypothetical protein